MRLVCRETRSKKISAAGVTGSSLPALPWVVCTETGRPAVLKGRDKAGKSLMGENLQQKFFSFRVRRKEKKPNQYAEIINIYANESLTKKTRKIKGTKMNFNGHVL